MEAKIMKESKEFIMSVEGENCENLYFRHLAKLINNSERNRYNLSVDPKKTSPLKMAKRVGYKRQFSKLPFVHIQDIEDYYDDYQKSKFYSLINDLREAEELLETSYELGYSNYTFELWMLLHVADMNYSVASRDKYLEPIKKWFNRDYKNIGEFKAEIEFQSILDSYVTLDSVSSAIKRAEKIIREKDGKGLEEYKGFKFYHDNPDLTVHMVVKKILNACMEKEWLKQKGILFEK